MATRWCEVCSMHPVRADGRCWSCYAYRRRTGRDRPEKLRIAECVREVDGTLERKAIPALTLVVRQQGQRPRLADRVEQAYEERRQRLARESSGQT